jgi:hypothetical protein
VEEYRISRPARNRHRRHTLRREQDRIGAVLRTIESRQVAVDASLDDWQEVMDLAVRFSTRCASAYRR